MRLLSTVLLICSEIWKVYNAGNGFQHNSELPQPNWLSIVLQPFAELTFSWTDLTGKGAQLPALLLWSLTKGIQNKLRKKVATTHL